MPLRLRGLATGSFTLGLSCLLAGPAAAQSSDSKLSSVLPDLLRSTVVLSPPSAPGVPSHAAHFLPTEVDNIYLVPNQFNAALLASLTTIPLGSTSGGFAFEGDPALGDYRPATRSYGPTFAERALTSGRGNFNFGFSFQAAKYDSFEGKELDSGDIKFYLRHIDCCGPTGSEQDFPNPQFEGDLVEASVSMKLETRTTAFLFNYGLTDRWDVGAAIPIVNVSLNAGIAARVDRVATQGTTTHVFPGDNPNERTQTAGGDATGLGDIVLRTKYRLLKAQGGGVAAGLDLRLPSGDEEDLLGLGTTQAKLLFIASKEFGVFAPHVNVSYAFSGHSSLQEIDIPKELGYTFGADVVVGKATVAFDIIGRTLFDAGRFVDTTRTFPQLGLPSATRTEFTREDGDLNQVLGVAGLKFPVMSKLLLTANALFSLNDAGLKAKFVPVIGFEYVFPRQ